MDRIAKTVRSIYPVIAEQIRPVRDHPWPVPRYRQRSGVARYSACAVKRSAVTLLDSSPGRLRSLKTSGRPDYRYPLPGMSTKSRSRESIDLIVSRGSIFFWTISPGS